MKSKFQDHHNTNIQQPVKVREKERESLCPHQECWKGRKIRTPLHVFQSFMPNHPTKTHSSNVDRHVLFKTTWLFVTNIKRNWEWEGWTRMRFAGVCDLQESFSNFESNAENERGNFRKSMNGFCSALLSLFCLFGFTLFASVLRNDYIPCWEKLSQCI